MYLGRKDKACLYRIKPVYLHTLLYVCYENYADMAYNSLILQENLWLDTHLFYVVK